MPQKRNPFLLEHVQGRSAALLGAFVHAWDSTHATPFTNSIAVGTEAVKPVFGAIQDLTDIIVLLRLVIAGARPNAKAMLQRAVSGFTVATAFADRLVAKGSAAFRTAHRLIGTAVLKTLERGAEEFPVVASSYLEECGISVAFHDLNPESVARSLEFGGGPGPSSLESSLENLQKKWASHYQQMRSQKRIWRDAELCLDETLQRLKSGSYANAPSL
jgi:argininosuccinate lyase